MKSIDFVVKGIIFSVGCCFSSLATYHLHKNDYSKEIKELAELSSKNRELFLMLKDWMKKKQEGKNLGDYLKKKGYTEIAIYGIADVGELFLDEVKNSGICVKYGIDRNVENLRENFAINIYKPEDKLSEVDAVIVTAITYFEEIEKILEKKVSCPILSIDDVITEV